MADINQWRRRIQPTRARTPALEFEDNDDVASPSTPKQGLKSKVSSYFDFRQHQHTKTASFNDDFESQLPKWPSDQLYPEPDAEDEMDSVMCVLMSDPYAQLDVRFNGALMRIFERLLALKGEKNQLQKRLDQETASSQAVLSKFNMAEKDWEDERRDYKDEIKRLEVLLAKTSKRGVAEVTLARQDSKLRRGRQSSDETKETIFEFLEEKMKRFDDRGYSSQRATMKPLLRSPTDKDKRMSQRLAQKKSITNIHADLPFGTPPDQRDMRFSLAQASTLEQQGRRRMRARAVTSSTDTSGDTFSAFSCEAAFPLPVRVNLEQAVNESEPVVDSDLSEIARLATVVARRRNIDLSQVLPQLLDLFRLQHSERAASAGTLNSLTGGFGVTAPTTKPIASTSVTSRSGHVVPVKRQTVMSKASGLFNKFKPQQLSIDSSSQVPGWPRRFSFEPGDDAAVQSPKAGSNTPRMDRLLRKSVSLDVLPQSSSTVVSVEQVLSPVTASPTASVVAAERPPSRIPTPVFSSGSLARPRQDREDSASSLLTAIRLADGPSKRSSSLCSSVYSSPSASREELGKTVQHEAGSVPDMASSSSNRLLDHTNALRGSAVLSPVARSASACGEITYDPRPSENKATARNYFSAYSNKSEMSDSRTENSRPTKTGSDARDFAS